MDVNRGLGGFSLGGIHPARRLAGSLSGVDTCDGGRCGVESSRVLVIGAYSAHLARPQHTNVADSPPAQRGNETVVGKAVIAIDLVGVASASRTGVHGSGDLVLGKVVAVKVQDHLPGGHGTKHVGLLSIEGEALVGRTTRGVLDDAGRDKGDNGQVDFRDDHSLATQFRIVKVNTSNS